MAEFSIKEIPGRDASTAVCEFYSREGNGIDIREHDLFFVGCIGEQLVGCVRFCMENGYAMLRTMRIAKTHQRCGYGLKLLKYFESYLQKNEIAEAFCIPYAHLERFYGAIGFTTIEDGLAPLFLRERLKIYREKPEKFLCMCRKT